MKRIATMKIDNPQLAGGRDYRDIAAAWKYVRAERERDVNERQRRDYVEVKT